MYHLYASSAEVGRVGSLDVALGVEQHKQGGCMH